jgi:hypothetical protein
MNISASVRRVLVLFSFIATVGILSSCEKYTYNPPAVDPNATWSLQTDIQPIFSSNCVGCHNGTRPPDLRVGESFEYLTTRGYVNLPAESSKLYLKIIDPGHAARSTAAEKLKVLYWITQGAMNN